MGIRFNLQTVNWLSYVLDPGAIVPTFQDTGQQVEAVRYLLRHLRDNFFSSADRHQQLTYLTNFEQVLEKRPELLSRIVGDLGAFFGNRVWTALLVPSTVTGIEQDYVCSRDLLTKLVQQVLGGGLPGLILQIEEPSDGIFALTDVFPTFRTALREVTSWPGMLIWTRRGDSAFFPFSSNSPGDVDNCALWLMRALGGDGIIRVPIRRLTTFPH
jgi:hypothetical protein